MAYVTALRGAAALVVAVGHTMSMPPPDHPPGTFFDATWGERALWPFRFGGQMVCLFLLVSGFALYWSEEGRRVRTGQGSSLGQFTARRMWRIAPTYYLALGLALVILFAGQTMAISPSESLDTSTPVTITGFLTHAVFLHNLDPQWVHQISPPLWSLAIEVQLYFLFPILFLGIWRKNPIMPVITLIIMTHLVDKITNTSLFGLMEFFGAGALLAWFLRDRKMTQPRVYLFGALIVFTIGMYLGPGSSDGLIGRCLWLAAFSLLVIGLHQSPGLTWRSPLGRTMIKIGEVSYSLYAIHFPIALAVWWAVGRFDLSRWQQVVLMLLVGGPPIWLITILVHRFIERPSTMKSQAI